MQMLYLLLRGGCIPDRYIKRRIIMKKSATKTIVATGLGAALFMVLFMFVKVPSPVPETNLQIAYGVSAFFAALFGPICGFLVAFIGHALNDFIAYGSPWWSWIVASGICALATGLASGKLAPQIEEGVFGKKELAIFLIYTLIGQALAWVVVAPVLDIVIYSEPVNLVFTQGAIAFVMDFICAGLIGGLLLKAYAASKAGRGTLTKDSNS